jgi:hypothetical protein
MVEMASSQLLQIGLLSGLYFQEKKIPNTTVNLFLKIKGYQIQDSMKNLFPANPAAMQWLRQFSY